MRKALITGVTGQDGSFLTALLLDKGYEVHGVVRRSSLPNTARLKGLIGNPHLHLHYGDVMDASAMIMLISKIQPNEIYNFAAQSDVHASFTMPAYTLQTNGLGTLSMLEGMRMLPDPSTCRFYQASTSEMFGNASTETQNEDTPFVPCSPYGASKVYAHWVVWNYRKAYGLHVTNGILFNHESPVRGEMFVSRKVTKAVGAWSKGSKEPIRLGNLDSKRDWGHTKDYVRGMWMMVQQPTPDDYVLASGESYSIREFVKQAFACIGRTVVWEGKGLEEKALDAKTKEVLVVVDPAFFRPVDVVALCGDASKARRILGWKPEISFLSLVREMVDADCA